MGLLILIVLGQESPGDPVPEILAMLADDRLEVRDEASRLLAEGGMYRLDRLRQSLDEAEDPEVRHRLKHVIHQIESDIRRWTFDGGTEVKGFKSRLTAEMTSALVGVEIRLQLEIMNVDSREKTLLIPTAVDLDLPQWSFTGTIGAATLRVTQVSGVRPARKVITEAGCSAPPEIEFVPLAPGQSWKLGIAVPTAPDRMDRLTPGEFEAIALAWVLDDGTAEQLKSNLLRVKVTESPEQRRAPLETCLETPPPKKR